MIKMITLYVHKAVSFPALGTRLPVTLLYFCYFASPSFADALPFTNAHFGEHSSPGTNLTYLYCHGEESRLIDCTYSTTTSCGVSNVAGVRCHGKTVASR